MADDQQSVVAVVVLFNPTPANIAHIVQLSEAGQKIVAVSNGLTEEQHAALISFQNILVINNYTNTGLAKALNQGIEQALANEAQYVLLLDQDSLLDIGLVNALRDSAQNLERRGIKLGCVAPRLVDRKHPNARVGAVGEPLTVATSGSLLPRQALIEVGPMWEPLFIDDIDHEWCFRARSKGFSICVATNVTIIHDMGDAGIRVGGRYRPIHRSPFRHYHIVRNTLWLQRCDYIPRGWRLSEFMKLGYRSLSYLVFSERRWETARLLYWGVIDGLLKVPPLPEMAQK